MHEFALETEDRSSRDNSLLKLTESLVARSTFRLIVLNASERGIPIVVVRRKPELPPGSHMRRISGTFERTSNQDPDQYSEILGA